MVISFLVTIIVDCLTPLLAITPASFNSCCGHDLQIYLRQYGVKNKWYAELHYTLYIPSKINHIRLTKMDLSWNYLSYLKLHLNVDLCTSSHQFWRNGELIPAISHSSLQIDLWMCWGHRHCRWGPMFCVVVDIVSGYNICYMYACYSMLYIRVR